MTSSLEHLPRRDLERLSAYLDGELSPEDQRRFEARLDQEPKLRSSLEEIRTTVTLLRAVPQVEVPRNYALTPEMAGQRRGWGVYPVLQMATAVAALAFMVVLGFDAASFAGGRQELLLDDLAAEVPRQQVPQAGEAPSAGDEEPLEEAAAELAEQEQPMAAQVTVEGEVEMFAGAADQVEAEEEAMEPQGTAPVSEMAESERAVGQTTPTASGPATAKAPTATIRPTDAPTAPATTTPAPLVGAVEPLEYRVARSTGLSRSLLRVTELALAALVIVLAAVTYRLRPRHR